MTVVNSHASPLGNVMANTAKALSIKAEQRQLKRRSAHVQEINKKQTNKQEKQVKTTENTQLKVLRTNIDG